MIAIQTMKVVKSPSDDGVLIEISGYEGFKQRLQHRDHTRGNGKLMFITIPSKARTIECGQHRTLSLIGHITKNILILILQESNPNLKMRYGRTMWIYERQRLYKCCIHEERM